MTEREWLECADPHPMLDFLAGKASERKLRLFACACCYRAAWYGQDKSSRLAVEVAERYADGRATEAELDVERAGLLDTLERRRTCFMNWFSAARWACERLVACQDFARNAALMAAEAAADSQLMGYDWTSNLYWSPYPDALAAAEKDQAAFLRDLFDDLWRPVAVSSVWLAWDHGSIPQLAQTVYEGDRFGDLPILADALEEAGCGDPALLGHCRARASHVRGCWALDLLLGKR